MILRATLCLILLAACGGDDQPIAPVEVATFPVAAKTDLDVLLLIDNTTNADNERALGAVAGKLFAEVGSGSNAPNLHIGLATSDLGATGSLDGRMHPGTSLGTGEQGGCVGSGEDGRMILPGGVAVSGSDPFIVDESDGSGGRTINYAGTLADTLQKLITGTGTAGCGFEQTLAGIGMAFTNPANAAFRRPAASLAIVVLSDEDDCSVRDPAFFDPSQTSPLGPITSFRCTKQGVTCDQPLGSAGNKTGCVPSVGNEYIEDISDLVAPVTASEPDPLRLSVSTIVAPPTPFTVDLVSPSPGATPIPDLKSSCSYMDANGGLSVADPAVRTAAWTTALNGKTYDICQNDYINTAAGIAAQMHTALVGDPCIHEPIPANTSCTVTLDTTPIPQCPAADTCYTFVADATCATDQRVDITYASPPPPTAIIHVSCLLP